MRVLRATAWNFELLFGAHLEEPQAREESAEQGDDDDADDAMTRTRLLSVMRERGRAAEEWA